MKFINSLYIMKGIKNPQKAVRYVKNRLYQYKRQKYFIGKFFDRGEFEKYKKEIENSGLNDQLYKKQYDFYNNNVNDGKTPRGNKYNLGEVNIPVGINLYSIIRKIKPQTAVETGVCNGFSTAFILLALWKNKTGKLYSIDFPEVAGKSYGKHTFWEGKGGAVIPEGREPGWMVPEYLKENWRLILGKSQEKLPHLLKKLKHIDFFMHDSEHSYGCMWFEFNEAYRYLTEGGILVSDDISKNTSFYEFTKEKSKSMIKIGKNTAFIFK